MNMKIIDVENVVFYYPGYEQSTEALRNITTSVDRGEFVAVVGHNGSGKSTFAKHLNAILTPKEGKVTIDGMDTCDEALLWEIRQKAGMVFQNPDNQMVATSVEEDVAFGPENLGVPTQEIRRRVDDALIKVDMKEFAASAPHLLSGGQKQRVSIAGVIAMRPEILILDEATAMLDPKGRKEVMQVVRSLNEGGITIVCITHNMEEAVYADRCLVFSEGSIEMEGTPREVFEQVKRIRELGLDVPDMVELSHQLRDRGVKMNVAFTVEDMVEELCRLL